MSAELLLREFEHLADQSEAPHMLRQFVLDMAVRGRLVEQDPGDEPASALVQRIAKKQGVKYPIEGGVLPGTRPERLFRLPASWAWVTATFPARLISDKGKKVQTKAVVPSGIFPVVDQGKVLIRGYTNDETKVVRVGTPIVLFGDHTREVKFIDFDFVVGADGVKLLEPVEILPSYYYLALRWMPLKARGYGRHFKLLRGASIPLPPLGEQNRIVAKVDELMALCDQLEAAQEEREVRRDGLRAASLHRLTASDSEKKPGSTDVRFFLDTSPRLITKPEHVASLRETILDLAVKGRLVPGNLKSWNHTTLGKACSKITDGTHRTPTYVDSGVPFVSVKDFSSGRLNFGSTRHISREEHVRLVQRCKPERGDILIGRIGTLGKPVVVDTDREFSLFVSVGLLKPRRDIVAPEYLRTFLESPTASAAFDRIKVGGGTHTNKLNLADLQDLVLALPPLGEQMRMVAKVDELMVLCDQLETALASAQGGRARLLEALLDEALLHEALEGEAVRNSAGTGTAV